MLRLSIALLVIARIAAVLGFGSIAGAAAEIAKIVFVLFLDPIRHLTPLRQAVSHLTVCGLGRVLSPA